MHTPEIPAIYPINITPLSDGKTLQSMRKGDICFSYRTEEDSRNNDYYTVLPIWKLNTGCYERASSVVALEGNGDGDRYNKRLRLGGSMGYNSLSSDSSLKIFPLTADEFKENMNWCGVLSQKNPDDSGNTGYGTTSSDLSNMPRTCSMAISGVVTLPCLVTENVQPGKFIFMVGSRVNQTFSGAVDARGRKIGRSLTIPTFQLRFMTTEDNSFPSITKYCSEIEQETRVVFPVTDPVFGTPINNVDPYNNVVMVKKTVIESPFIQTLGVITRVDCPIPTPMDVQAALSSAEGWRDLLKDCPLRVNLVTQGWGPYNWKI
jgi:hypothetical protein